MMPRSETAATGPRGGVDGIAARGTVVLLLVIAIRERKNLGEDWICKVMEARREVRELTVRES
jgi:hypothetical protein